MLVYRVQHKDTDEGPYVGSKSVNQLCMNHNGRSFHDRPSGCNDGIYEGFFACPSMEALMEWFDGFMSKLRKCGFVIAVYDVDPMFVTMGKSGLQCGITDNDVTPIQILPIS